MANKIFPVVALYVLMNALLSHPLPLQCYVEFQGIPEWYISHKFHTNTSKNPEFVYTNVASNLVLL